MKNKFEESKSRLEQILASIIDIEQYTENKDCNSFCSNHILHDAVLLKFIVIGEAINHVESEILDKYDYPWYKVRSFRNLIAHEYFNIKLEAVWQIVEDNIPELKDIINVLLKNEF